MLGGVGEKFTINNSQFTIDFPATLNALNALNALINPFLKSFFSF